jgi:hypothetical protein
MIANLKLSRITKARIDRLSDNMDFDVAETSLGLIHVAVILSPAQAGTAAGQAAALTAIATCVKCFGNATLLADPEAKLVKKLAIGETLGASVKALGGNIEPAIPQNVTHAIAIGDGLDVSCPIVIRCWWDRWLSGVVPAFDNRLLGASDNPLAGIFSGALAVREVFSTFLGSSRAGNRVSLLSLWEPWLHPEVATAGPAEVYMPSKFWFIGLGHLGQGYLWNLGFLPRVGSLAVLQDDQLAGEENVATGLLTRASDVNVLKTRIAAKWLEGAAWQTSLIERRHHGDIFPQDGDPAIVITGLDDPQPRREIACAGFSYMLDAGVGGGPVDFESLQISLLKKGTDPSKFWPGSVQPKDIEALMQRKPYRDHSGNGGCGTVSLAQASVAVPFVGAAVGAVVMAQAIRLASMLPTVKIMGMQLSSPGMVSVALNDPPDASIGSIKLSL